jgi:hypothetical protein
MPMIKFISLSIDKPREWIGEKDELLAVGEFESLLAKLETEEPNLLILKLDLRSLKIN